jgi:hypothetical protein
MSTKGGNILITEPLFSKKYLEEYTSDASFLEKEYVTQKSQEEKLKTTLSDKQQLVKETTNLLLQSVFQAAEPKSQKLVTKKPDAYLSELQWHFQILERSRNGEAEARRRLEKTQESYSKYWKGMDQYKVFRAGAFSRTPRNMAKRKLLEEGMTLCSFEKLDHPFNRHHRENIFGKFDAKAVLDIIGKDPDELATYLHQKALLEQMFLDPEKHKKHGHGDDWRANNCPMCWLIEEESSTAEEELMESSCSSTVSCYGIKKLK